MKFGEWKNYHLWVGHNILTVFSKGRLLLQALNHVRFVDLCILKKGCYDIFVVYFYICVKIC